MARPFSHDLSVSGSPVDVQARLRGILTERLRRTARMRLATEEPNSLAFRPRMQWPLVVMLYRTARGEVVNVKFEAVEGGTQVAVSGKVGGNAEAVGDREFWEEVLSAV